MINIIKHGNVKTYKVECNRCKSILEYTEHDEQFDYLPDGYFGTEISYYIICPVCGKRTITHANSDCGDVDFRIKNNI